MSREKPKPWSRSDVPDLTGKVAIVTGGTAGIGYETAKALVEAGAEVIILGRNVKRGEEAVENLKKFAKNPSDAKVAFFSVDFGNLASIRDFAKTFSERGIALDILVNNAGIGAPLTRTLTEDGYEATMATNHLAPFALTGLLLPSLKKSSYPARVVNVSSGMAKMGKIDLEDFHSEKKSYPGAKLYSASKLANLLFTLELKRKSEANGWGILAIAVHPGLVKTDMTAVRPGNDSFFTKFVGATLLPIWGQEAVDGANASVFASTSPSAEAGEFYGPNGFLGMRGNVEKTSMPESAKNAEVATKLWELSGQLTSVSYA